MKYRRYSDIDHPPMVSESDLPSFYNAFLNMSCRGNWNRCFVWFV